MHDARGAFTLWVTATYLLCRSTWMLISSLGLWIYLNGMAFVKRQHLAAHEYRCIRCQSLYFLYTQIRHFLSLYLFATTRCVCFQPFTSLVTLSHPRQPFTWIGECWWVRTQLINTIDFSPFMFFITFWINQWLPNMLCAFCQFCIEWVWLWICHSIASGPYRPGLRDGSQNRLPQWTSTRHVHYPQGY